MVISLLRQFPWPGKGYRLHTFFSGIEHFLIDRIVDADAEDADGTDEDA